MASPFKFRDFKSPHGAPSLDISGSQSPERNPFDILKKVEGANDLEFKNSPFKSLNTSFKDIDRPSVSPFELNSSDMLARESLGILSNSALCRDSLTPGLFINVLDTSGLSPRESLGILNLSAMDLGRESIGLFNINNSFLRRKSIGNEVETVSFNLDDFNFDNIENGLKTIKKSPLQIETAVPELIVSPSNPQDNINSFLGLNNAFLLPHSRLLSAVSSGSSHSASLNPYFNSRSLEEPSKISSGSPQRDFQMSKSILVTTDPFNEGFQISTNENNKHSTSQILTSTCTKDSFGSTVEHIRKRIQSLPVALEDNNIFGHFHLETEGSNVSFQGAMICRAMEEEKEFDDSVFVEARRVASIIADTSVDVDEKSSGSNEHNILDSTPQPEWPTELDSSHSNVEERIKPLKCSQETMLKQVDKMLGMQPVNLEEKLNLKNGSRSESSSSENMSQNISKISPGNNAENQSRASNDISQNISKISRASQDGHAGNHSCTSNNFSQNLSKISQATDENVSRLIQNLSDILNDRGNLSQTQKEKGQHILQCLANLFSEGKNKSSCSAEDSGHSSVDDQHLEELKCSTSEAKIVEATGSNGDGICRALDLSCKSKSGDGEVHRRLSLPKSPAPVGIPAPYIAKTPSRLVLTNTSSTSIASDTNKNSRANYSNASNCSNASAKSGNVSTASRNSNISQNRVSLNAGKLRKSKVGVVVTKKGPLRAVLPVENMAKGTKGLAKGSEAPLTPERKEGLKFGLSSKKTSTPIQEPKLKPMAASTPANRQSKDSNPASSSPRPNYNRSFSYQPTTLESSQTSKTRQSVSSKSRTKDDETKLSRRNSITEGTLSLHKGGEGSTRIKRSFSTGKEPKILSALSRVRQNILSSPYYNPKKGAEVCQSDALTENVKKTGTDLKRCGQELKRLSMISQPKKVGKENLKP